LECFPFTVSTQLANRLVRSQTHSLLSNSRSAVGRYIHTPPAESETEQTEHNTHTHTTTAAETQQTALHSYLRSSIASYCYSVSDLKIQTLIP